MSTVKVGVTSSYKGVMLRSKHIWRGRMNHCPKCGASCSQIPDLDMECPRYSLRTQELKRVKREMELQKFQMFGCVFLENDGEGFVISSTNSLPLGRKPRRSSRELNHKKTTYPKGLRKKY